MPSLLFDNSLYLKASNPLHRAMSAKTKESNIKVKRRSTKING